MDDIRSTTSAPPRYGLAALSLGAALIHAAAISAHEEHTTLLVGFVAAAILQGAWALAVLARPASRLVLAAGLGINATLVAVYLASRTTGLPVDGLERAEPFGFQDLTCFEFEVLLTIGCLAALTPSLFARRLRCASIAAPVLGVALALVAVPALAVGESHEHSADGGHDHGAAAADADEPDATHDDGHAHVDAEVQPGVTAEQQERADELVADTEAGLARWADPAAATADGFRSIGDGRRPGGYEHFINVEYLASPETLDPEQPESLVYLNNGDGTKTLVSAMYIMAPSSTIDDVPDVGGALTVWHDHDNLCWNEATGQLAGVLVDGVCRPGGTFRGTSAPMLHVWVVENPCGPFAGIDGGGGAGGHGESCDHGH